MRRLEQLGIVAGLPPRRAADRAARLADDGPGQPAHPPRPGWRTGSRRVAQQPACRLGAGTRSVPGGCRPRRRLVPRHGHRALFAQLRGAGTRLVGTRGLAGGAVWPRLPGAVRLPGRGSTAGWPRSCSRCRRTSPGTVRSAPQRDRGPAGPPRPGARGGAGALRRDRPAPRESPDRERAARHRRPRDQRDGDPGSRRSTPGRRRPRSRQGGVRGHLGVRPTGHQGPRAPHRAPRWQRGLCGRRARSLPRRRGGHPCGPQRDEGHPVGSRATATGSPHRSHTWPSEWSRRAPPTRCAMRRGPRCGS